ncbi:MAG: DHH family phosphoesterase [Bacteroidales bacterium]|nr:DHH family phosphoesterase [Candidatus Cacconaster merdequi]
MRKSTSLLEKALQKAEKVVLVGHFNPDGDSVGSVVGAYHYLASRGILSTMVLPGDYPKSLSFLDTGRKGEGIVSYQQKPEQALRAIGSADTIICLDFNRFSRTEQLAGALGESKAFKILIDHHIAPEEKEFDIVISTIRTSSACELLFWTLMDLPDIAGKVERLPMACANALYVGMMTDTNNFSNSCLPSTFNMASLLIRRGVNKDRLQEKVMHCYSVPRTKLMGYLLSEKMIYLSDMKAACITLSNSEKRKYHFKPGDSEGFVNQPLSIKSVRISALFTENNDGQYVRVSLRSKGNMDVNRLAQRFFNGGGHKNAAGGRLFIPIEDVPQYFAESLRKYLSGDGR